MFEAASLFDRRLHEKAIAGMILEVIIAELIRKPEVDAKLRELQLAPVGSTPAEAVKFFAEETALWSKVIKDANVKPQ